MPRALSLYLPNWSVELVKRRDRSSNNIPHPPHSHSSPQDEAIILVRTEQQRPVVAACCGIAQRSGASPGMSVADARALIRSGRVRLEPHRADHDHAALESLARWATRFSPIVAPDPPDGLLINITGCSRVFRGERRLLRKLLVGVHRLGFTCRGAIAPTFGAAWALARCSAANPIVEDRELHESLAKLPVWSLRIDEETVAGLDEVGVRRIGELLALPRQTLPSRFGPELLERIDQAIGHAFETIRPVKYKEPIRAERLLDGPTTGLDVLAIVTRTLLDAVVRELTTRHLGVRRLDALFDRPRLEPQILTVAIGRPSRDSRHLWSLLWPRIERMHLGDGVERVELHVVRSARLRDEQLGYWDTENADAARELAQLCDTLANRIGPDRVARVRLAESHIPERAWMMESEAQRQEHGRDAHATDEAGGDRPTLLIHPPELIRTIAGAGEAPPWRITWRDRDATIITSIGPERICEVWWDLDTPALRAGSGSALHIPSGAARDYFKVQDEIGRWLWVFRQTGTSRWFLHGLWA